jgi:hypothetical protein
VPGEDQQRAFFVKLIAAWPMGWRVTARRDDAFTYTFRKRRSSFPIDG